MHVYFSGIGGSGIGSLALIAHQAGYSVSGSDQKTSDYIANLRASGITNITIGQTTENIASVHEKTPIDWFVYSSAVPTDHPEIQFAGQHDIKHSKRDEFINKLLQDTGQRMIAIAGTHGKTTTTAHCIWLFKQLGIPISYSVGAKLPFGAMGEFDAQAEYFVYEADEYDRNFLSFEPAISIIAGIDWDHPDIYPTRPEYYAAFQQFIDQSEHTIMWQSDAERIGAAASDHVSAIADDTDLSQLSLIGEVNRRNAFLVSHAVAGHDPEQNYDILNAFPGVSRRFERITSNIYTDYAHTPEKIRGAIGIASEVSGNIVVVYEGLHNTRQHFIKDELGELFTGVSRLYVVPSYLAREDESLALLTPEDLCQITTVPEERHPAQLNNALASTIREISTAGHLVLCLSAGGGGSLDEWLRRTFEHDKEDH